MTRFSTRLLLGPEPMRGGSGAADAGATHTANVIVLVAGVSFVAGVIHVGASIDHAREFPLYAPVFALFAAFQIGWALVVTRRSSRRVLVAGIAFNAAIVALWVASRTVGVPIASHAWVPEPVGAADLMSTVAESVIVISTACVGLSPRLRFACRALPPLEPVLLAVLFLSVTYAVAGGHAR